MTVREAIQGFLVRVPVTIPGAVGKQGIVRLQGRKHFRRAAGVAAVVSGLQNVQLREASGIALQVPEQQRLLLQRQISGEEHAEVAEV